MLVRQESGDILVPVIPWIVSKADDQGAGFLSGVHAGSVGPGVQLGFEPKSPQPARDPPWDTGARSVRRRGPGSRRKGPAVGTERAGARRSVWVRGPVSRRPHPRIARCNGRRLVVVFGDAR